MGAPLHAITGSSLSVISLPSIIYKCMPWLMYGLECYTLPKSSLRSLDSVVVRFLMKLFKTVNNEIIRECCSYFKFPFPSELLDNRMVKFQSNFMLCTGILHYFGIKT